MADAQTVALDQILSRRRHIKQQVDDMVLEQIDLVDVKKAAMRLGQQAGLEMLLAPGQRLFQIQRADDPILGRAERQVDKRNGHFADAFARAGVRAIIALLGFAMETASVHCPDRRQGGGQCPCGRRLAGSAVSKDHHAADAGIDRCHQQRQLHLFLTDDCAKGKTAHCSTLSQAFAAASKVGG